MNIPTGLIDAAVSSYAFPVPEGGVASPLQLNSPNDAALPFAPPAVLSGPSSGAAVSAGSNPSTAPLAGADSLPDTPGVVFASSRRKPWQVLQDTAREHGVSLSKQEAIKLAQQQNQQKQREAASKKEGDADNGGDQHAEFSITRSAEHLLDEVGNTLSNSVHTIASNPFSVDALGAAAVLAVVGGLSLAAA